MYIMFNTLYIMLNFMQIIRENFRCYTPYVIFPTITMQKNKIIFFLLLSFFYLCFILSSLCIFFFFFRFIRTAHSYVIPYFFTLFFTSFKPSQSSSFFIPLLRDKSFFVTVVFTLWTFWPTTQLFYYQRHFLLNIFIALFFTIALLFLLSNKHLLDVNKLYALSWSFIFLFSTNKIF